MPSFLPVLLAAAALCACSARPVPLSLGADSPADPSAPAVPFVRPANVLAATQTPATVSPAPMETSGKMAGMPMPVSPRAAGTPPIRAVNPAGCASARFDRAFAGTVRQLAGAALLPDRVGGTGSGLARPLEASGAVQVALLCNPGLRASLAEVGLAQADLVQAGLLSNPVLDLGVRFPDRLYGITDVAVALSQNLLGLILLPARRQVAAAQADAARFRVAADVLDLAADVRVAYWRLRADQALAGLLGGRAASADASAALAARLHDAGNISDLDLAREQADAEATRTEYADALAGAAEDREELDRLMGLSGGQAGWTVLDEMPGLPPDDLPYERFESMAVEGNLRIAALRRQAEASAKALGIARDYGWLTNVQLGVSTEQNPEGYRVTGPTFALPIPLFDRGQAARARAAVVLRQQEDRLAQLATDIRSKVRALRDRLVRDRDLADRYRNVVVPLRQRILALGVRQYDFMLLGPFDLLRAKQDEISASRRLIEARRDWWIEAAELQRALGGPPDAAHAQPDPTLSDIEETRP